MAKKKAAGLPKRLAGVKVPKRLRKKVGRIAGWLGRPVAKALMGSAVAIVAGAIAGHRQNEKPGKSAGR